jgi:3,4-dihydroxy 2-butanone 4-phosphate synthase/GTP cyclohydrolase II
MPFSSIEEAAADIRDGRMVIIVDDEDRENEGDLVCAAEKVTPEIINFMATHARGLICMPLTEERCDELHLTMQVADNTSFLGTAFTISIEARRGVTTGISAADRATTILTAVDAKTKPSDLARPGHIFPLRARQGGVLVRPGQTEASVDMARIAGLYPAGVICEIMNPDGTMARLPELREFARTHDLKIISVADLVRYRMQKETLVRRAAEAEIKTVYGRFHAVAFENVINSEVHLAMVMGDVRTAETVLVRVHTANITGDVFGSLMDDTNFQLHTAFREDRLGRVRRGALFEAAPARPRPHAPVAHLRPDARTRPDLRGGEHRDGLRREPRLRRRRANPARVGPQPHPAVDESSAQSDRARRLRVGGRRPCAARFTGERNSERETMKASRFVLSRFSCPPSK